METPVPKWLKVIKLLALPAEPINILNKLNTFLWRNAFEIISDFLSCKPCVIGIGKPSEFALHILQQHSNIHSIYDAMDDFPYFYDGLARTSMELKTNRITSKVSRILVSSEALYKKFGNHKSKLSIVKNACDINNLPSLYSTTYIREKSVLGYVGTIGHWFNWSFIFALAEANPSIHIHLTGPIYINPPKIIPDNISLFPACDNLAAMRVMQKFSVGLIPFKCTKLTESVDPVKYYEYRSLGLPVISSKFGEMVSRDHETGVFLADESSDLMFQTRAALNHEDSVADIELFRNENSWTVRFDESNILSI